jgi:putative addiction module component (TIGR02574 family)
LAPFTVGGERRLFFVVYFGEPANTGLYFNQALNDAAMSVKFVLPDEIRNLPVSERLKLVEAIWDSITESPDQVPLTKAQLAVLEERLAEYEKNPDAGSSWEEVKERILKRK